ncbi:SAM-dependent methyltransferase [Novosphingobium sp. SG751A]|uniref:methyltransferase domain-containing protein n=1 Tax=Novosphingobium sp. SG751A TaxID=2587000 RepID=UPI001556DDA9|nr:methyltransferase domain-containing protein [Novosphingobium sp. SG751A]NOW45492.1 SAM-dependent methyltransferase [Novosphingobium sp. SG751A]
MDWGGFVGEEARKNFDRWVKSGFYQQFLSGDCVLDIGFAGYLDGVRPITPNAIGVGLDYPGYDGKILPFQDFSQDTVFASHCLEHIDDYRTVIADWFRVLKVGGYLLITVPHQYLYERNLDLPSRFNADHRRYYTAASLLREVEEAIDPLQFRVRQLEDNDRGFDYAIPPSQHAVGCYEILLVIEKIQTPVYAEELNAPPFIGSAPSGRFIGRPRSEADSAVMSITAAGAPRSVIIFKMDHYGDFIAASPVLADLPHAFPDARLTLVCGAWNVEAAHKLGVFDEIIPFSLFARTPRLGATVDLFDQLNELEALLADRRFDLAVDLRVDGDTRLVLKHVNAGVRAGFGTTKAFPYLDIALPMGSPTTQNRSAVLFCDATRFECRGGSHLGHAISLPAGVYAKGSTLIWGPYVAIEPGEYLITLLLNDESGSVPPFDFDIACNSGNTRLAVGSCQAIASDGLTLAVDEPVTDLEIRIWGDDKHALETKMRGCMITKWGQVGGPHQTELMAMLVALVQHRAVITPFEERVA